MNSIRGGGANSVFGRKNRNQPASGADEHNPVALGIAMGVAIGAGIGAALDNVGVGIAIGIAIGAALGTTLSGKNQ